MPAKILVTSQRGGSRVELIGRSGKQLMTSEVFREPRAKAAIVRALKALLGTEVAVEDNTLSAKPTVVSKRRLNGKVPSTSKSSATSKASSTSKTPLARKSATTRKRSATRESVATTRSRALKTSRPAKGTAAAVARPPAKAVSADGGSETRQTPRGRPRKAG